MAWKLSVENFQQPRCVNTHVAVVSDHLHFSPHACNGSIGQIRAIHQADTVHRAEDDYESAIDSVLDLAAFFRREPSDWVILVWSAWRGCLGLLESGLGVDDLVILSNGRHDEQI